MGTFSTAEPTNVAGWSEEVSGEIVSMYNQGKYGYAYYSKCAVTRLSDNSVCVRIKMYSNAIMGWGAAIILPLLITTRFRQRIPARR